MYNRTMSEEQKKLIKQLREKTLKVKVSDAGEVGAPINKDEAWKKAKKAGSTISDDNLFPNDNQRP
jgi:hypothetical protein